MEYLREYATEADIDIQVQPNVVYIADARKVIYNYLPKGVFIQHINGSIYTVEQWAAKGFSNDRANGIAIITDETKVLMAKNNLGTAKWSSNRSDVSGILTTTDKNTALTDFNGYENTQLMLATDTSGAGYMCANYEFPNGTKGYLPAAGELNMLLNNKTAINTALLAIGEAELSKVSVYSSTQYSSSRVWYMSSYGGFTDMGKENTLLVIPFGPLGL